MNFRKVIQSSNKRELKLNVRIINTDVDNTTVDKKIMPVVLQGISDLYLEYS